MKKTANSLEKSHLILSGQEMIKNGLSVIPVYAETKQPVGSWSKYQKKIMKKSRLKRLIEEKDATGIAVIGGKVSGGLECLDFDDLAFFIAFRAIVKEENPALWDGLYVEETQSGGRHVAYRCPKAKELKSCKLAFKLVEAKKFSSNGKQAQYKGKTHPVREIDGEKYITPATIETKGEGGYCVCAPSPKYTRKKGRLTDLPDITVKERKVLHRIARSLNEWVPPEKIENGPEDSEASTGTRPGDIYNAKGNPREVLLKHGWTPTGITGKKFEHFCRPGKKGSPSASLINGKIFYCFSTNAAPFEGEKAYSPFAVYALLEHGGDYPAAAKALARQGYAEDSQSEKALPAVTGELPKPIMADAHAKPPVFPLDALPKTMREYVDVHSRQLSVSQDYIAVPLIISIAGFIGKTPHLRPFPNNPWTVRACAWGMVIGKPGERKSPALDEATTIFRGVDWDLEDQYKKDLEFWKKQEKARKQEMEEEDSEYDLDSDSPQPVEKRLIVVDATVEELASIMENSPGLTLIRDELAGFLRGINKYKKGGDEAFYLQCWSGGSFKTDRIGRKGESIRDVYLNIIGTIQPRIVPELLQPGQEGMIERFSLMAYSPQPKLKIFKGNPREDLNHAIRDIGLKLLEPEWRFNLNTVKEKPFIPLTEKAVSLWIEWMLSHDKVVQRMKEKTVAGLYAKMSGNILSLALILHLFKWADGESSKLEVGTKSLKSAITLYEDFFAPIWHRVFNEIESSPFEKNVSSVKKFIQRRRLTEIKARDVQTQKIGTLFRVQDVEDVLDFLMEQHWLLRTEERQHPKGGPKSKVYIVNPRVHEKTK